MSKTLKIMVIGTGTRFDAVISGLSKHKVYSVLAEKYFIYKGIKYDDISLYKLSTNEDIDLVVVAGLNRKLSKYWTSINSIVYMEESA